MIAIQTVTAEHVQLFKAVRLRALQEAPHAFGATYAYESQLTDEDWLQRTLRWNGEKGIGFLAMDGTAGCGIAGCFLDPEDTKRAQLVSMWTDPAYRQQGVGRQLVNAVIGWAQQRGARTLQLLVTSNNHSATRFYERLDFHRTGRTEPYPNDPKIVEYEMTLAI
ncbi:MAG TPA: GNAT family N-acetyltransferase [Terriglobales bacterium]|nr:GNAT family N-acetyltransferase [Terriglobales bacterium]